MKITDSLKLVYNMLNTISVKGEEDILKLYNSLVGIKEFISLVEMGKLEIVEKTEEKVKMDIESIIEGKGNE